MNKYQKIALFAGLVILGLLFGKTVTQVGFRAIGSLFSLMGKFLIVIIAILMVISFLKKGRKNK
jgi:hypothetical protein